MNPLVLLLDDSRENHELLPRMLKGLPGMDTVQTVCFARGGEALAWCRENQPDLCVVDYQMPGMDGITFITEARKLPRFGGIPMIMITGASDTDLRQRALMNGANDFLTRPVEAGEFKARVYGLLSLRLSLVNPPDKIAGSREQRRETPVAEPRIQPGRWSTATSAPSDVSARGGQRVERLAHDVAALDFEAGAMERAHHAVVADRFSLDRRARQATEGQPRVGTERRQRVHLLVAADEQDALALHAHFLRLAVGQVP